MNFPVVIDIAIGLIFIYLTLSLLSAEIQELITTVLQWRAEHLKQSIAFLFERNQTSTQPSQTFIDHFYKTSLIQSLNHEAQGLLSQISARFGQTIRSLYHLITRTPSVFGEDKTGPSYIPAQAFSEALIQQLHIRELAHKYSELIFRQALEDKLQQIKVLLSDLRHSVANDHLFEREFEQLVRNLNRITQEFYCKRLPFSDAIYQAIAHLLEFLDTVNYLLKDQDGCQEIVRDRIPYLRQSIGLVIHSPTLSETINLIVETKNYDALHPELLDIILKILIADQPISAASLTVLEKIKLLHQHQNYLPRQLRDNLVDLSRIAQSKVQDLDTSLKQLETEIASWFEQSMERASGVYTRNAKGFALLIGILIAYTTNADTFHIVNRLSQDTDLRIAIRNAAVELEVAQSSTDFPSIEESVEEFSEELPGNVASPDLSVPSPSPSSQSENDKDTLEQLRISLEQSLEKLSLPIGRSPITLSQQNKESADWPVPILRRVLGWIITGIAISMGASFWYDLLKKVVSVRNPGKSS